MKPFLYVMAIVCTIPCFLPAATAAPTIGEWRAIETADTLDVFFKDRIVGTLIQSTRPADSVQGIIESSSMTVGKEEAGVSQMEVFEQRVYNIDGDLRSARQVMKSQSGSNTWTLFKSPQGWRLSVEAGGETSASIIDGFHESLFPTLTIFKKVRRLQVSVGETWSDTTLDLVSGRPAFSSYRCAAIDTSRKTITFDVADNMTGRHEEWQVDGSGKTLVREMEGFVAKKSVPLGKKGRAEERVDIADLSDLFSVPVARGARSNEYIAVVLAPDAAMDSSVSDLYIRKGDRWLFGKGAAACSCASIVAPDSALLQWTRPTATLQSNNPSIVQLSRRIVGEEKAPCAIVRLLNRHVFTALEKRNSVTFSNALETLKAGFGRCRDHAVLLAALLRSSGVPAHVMLGLVYVESKKAYMGHAWVMVWAGRWIFADPAFGVFPVCTGRVPLLMDDNGRNSILLAKLIGKISIEYVAEQ